MQNMTTYKLQIKNYTKVEVIPIQIDIIQYKLITIKYKREKCAIYKLEYNCGKLHVPCWINNFKIILSWPCNSVQQCFSTVRNNQKIQRYLKRKKKNNKERIVKMPRCEIVKKRYIYISNERVWLYQDKNKPNN